MELRSEERGCWPPEREWRGVSTSLSEASTAMFEVEISRLTRYCSYLERQWEDGGRPVCLAEWEDAAIDLQKEAA
jgi:hypothetical protein